MTSGGTSPRWIAATLGSRLGPDWTAGALLRWLTEQRGGPVLEIPDQPAAYLGRLLDRLLTRDVAPPHPARRHDQHRRDVVATGGEKLAANAAQRTAAFDERDQAATPRGGTAAGQVRALRDRLPGHLRRPERIALLNNQAAAPTWPKVATPGGGLPADWHHGADRHSD